MNNKPNIDTAPSGAKALALDSNDNWWWLFEAISEDDTAWVEFENLEEEK